MFDSFTNQLARCEVIFQDFSFRFFLDVFFAISLNAYNIISILSRDYLTFLTNHMTNHLTIRWKKFLSV